MFAFSTRISSSFAKIKHFESRNDAIATSELHLKYPSQLVGTRATENFHVLDVCTCKSYRMLRCLFGDFQFYGALLLETGTTLHTHASQRDVYQHGRVIRKATQATTVGASRHDAGVAGASATARDSATFRLLRK